ncbi:hypothetical protein E4U19_007114 [Claviceps sp. Clav32 group G5]|nr:hypothetical protein E4U19_007114 [Claviceps sp. Clav32 group G5]
MSSKSSCLSPANGLNIPNVLGVAKSSARTPVLPILNVLAYAERIANSVQQIFDERRSLRSLSSRASRFRSEDAMRTTLEQRIRRIGHESTLTIFVLDHIEIPLKKILEELKAVDEDCVFFATDVDRRFELEPRQISNILVESM